MNRFAIIAALMSTLLLSGCGAILDIAGKRPVPSRPSPTAGRVPAPGPGSAPPAEMGPYGAKTNPYTVRGVRYYPLKSAHGYEETGIASWYGAENHGMRTASGSIYNMYSISAAHKTLPLGTIVRVTNLENNRSLEALVNDRGPFIRGRLIDMSYGAARQLGFDGQGLTRVHVKAVGTHGTYVAKAPAASRPAPPPAPKPEVRTAQAPPSGQLYVQVGAFSQRANAVKVLGDLERAGISEAVIETRLARSGPLHVVRAGPYRHKDDASRALGTLRTLYPASFIAAL